MSQYQKLSTGMYVSTPVIFYVDQRIFSKPKYFHFETFPRKFLIFDKPKTKISIKEHCFYYADLNLVSF